jgi:hypothetical protein
MTVWVLCVSMEQNNATTDDTHVSRVATPDGDIATRRTHSY